MHRLWQPAKVLIGNIYIAVVCNWRQLLGLPNLGRENGELEVCSLAFAFRKIYVRGQALQSRT